MADESHNMDNSSIFRITQSPDKKQASKMMKGAKSTKNFSAIELQNLRDNIEETIEPQVTDNKKLKTIFFNRHVLTEEKVYKTSIKEIFYLVCYDPIENEIFFCNFEGEDTVVQEKEVILRHDIDKELKSRLYEFGKDWGRINKLSHFEEEEYISEKSYDYFRRPFNSKFLYPEKLGLNHLTSTYPLPAAFQAYKEVTLEIVIHDSVFDMNELPETLRFNISRKVGFYYV
jgi:hypothetical protein